MNKPTHEEIAQRAHRIWQESGSSGGDATQNWLEAERQLTAAPAKPSAGAKAPEHSAPRPLAESQSDHAIAERAAQQRKEARQPQVPTHTGPKPTPPESGKPLWNQPHSS